MDKYEEDKRSTILTTKKENFEAKAGNFKLNFYQTSIWEPSLYKAFSNILSSIVKNNDKIQKILEVYGRACDADEVILFDKKTLLAISSFGNKKIKDEERIEKMCFSMKKFKSNYKNSSNKFNDFIIKNKSNIIYFDELNRSSYIMAVLSNKSASLELLKLNLEIIRKEIENLI